MQNLSILILFVKTISNKKVIRLFHCVDFFLSDSFKDMGNFRDFNLVLMAGDRICPLQIDR